MANIAKFLLNTKNRAVEKVDSPRNALDNISFNGSRFGRSHFRLFYASAWILSFACCVDRLFLIALPLVCPPVYVNFFSLIFNMTM